MDYAEGDYTAEKIHQFFKKKFPDVMINDVFDTDSDYNEGRTVSGTDQGLTKANYANFRLVARS